MDKLPIIQYEYDRSALLVDFLAKVRNCIKINSNISDVLFCPQIKGYEITYLKDENNIKIEIKVSGILSSRLKIKIYKNGVFKSSYLSKSHEDNSTVVQKILI